MTVPMPEDGRPQSAIVPELHPHSLLEHDVVTSPLIDANERARVGIPTGDNETIPIVIELDFSHPGGVDEAYDLFCEIWQGTMSGPTPERFEEYLRVLLTMTQVRSLVQDDQARPDGRRAMHRVWPDFPVDILDALRAEPETD